MPRMRVKALCMCKAPIVDPFVRETPEGQGKSGDSDGVRSPAGLIEDARSDIVPSESLILHVQIGEEGEEPKTFDGGIGLPPGL